MSLTYGLRDYVNLLILQDYDAFYTGLSKPNLVLVGTALLIISGITISTNVFTLIYLGFTFDSAESEIEGDSWQPKWILVFAWIRLFVVILMSFVVNLSSTSVKLFIIFSILTSVFTIVYMGPFLKDIKDYDAKDWKRKWIIFFSWFGLVSSSVIFLWCLTPVTFKVFRRQFTGWKPSYTSSLRIDPKNLNNSSG